MAEVTPADPPNNRGVIAFLVLSVVGALVDIIIGGRYAPRSTLIVVDVLGLATEALFVYLVRWRGKRWPWIVGTVLLALATVQALATVMSPEEGGYNSDPPSWFLILEFALALAMIILWLCQGLRPRRQLTGEAEPRRG